MRRFWAILLGSLFFCAVSCQECGDCPSPPEGFRFQVVDVLGRDLVRSSRARYSANEVTMHYNALGKVYPVLLTVDTFQQGKAIFEAPFAAQIVAMGYPKLVLTVAGEMDTIAPRIAQLKTYCCKYTVYNFVLMNEDTLARSPNDDFVFWVKKK